MPFPFVAVTLPPDTPPAYVTALLEACTQAYGEGECKSVPDAEKSGNSSADGSADANDASERPSKPTGSPPADLPVATAAPGDQAEGERRILASVSWQDALRAEILLGFPHWVNSRWIEWHLDFKEQDQLVERHRTVGFALGRLAVTAAQVAQREREAQTSANDPNPTPDPVQPAVEPAPDPLPKPSAATKPPVFLEPLPIPSEHNNDPTSVHAAALLGAELGAGFQGVRIGGNAGVDLVFSNRFVLGVRGFLSGDSFHATFAGAELHGGVMWQPEPIEIELSVGVGWNYVTARVDKEASEHVVGGVGNVSIALANSLISPFLTVGGSVLQEGIDTNVPNMNAYGPFVPRVRVGIKLRPDLF